MKLSTRVHGVLDYLLGIVLIAAPWLLGFAQGGAETFVPVGVGIAIILYSFFTNYEMGALKGISIRTHLWLDALGGIFLAASPWLFDFNEVVFRPHLFVGLFTVIFALITSTTPKKPEVISRVKREDKVLVDEY